jgi:RHS repeat-associated protein
MTDSSGNMVNKYAYDEFGNLSNAEETISNPFLYVGRYGVTDDDNGLLYMRARYYDPQVGRFINKDPVRYKGGINLFAYVQNNPINREDPFGLRTTAVRFNFTFITADFTIGAVWDDKGNFGTQITPAMGLSISAGVTVGFTVTDAPCIDNLNGMGTVAGVAASVPFAAPLQFEFGHVWSGWPTPGQYANSSYTGWDFGVLGVGIGLPTLQVFVGPTVIIPVYRGR